MTSTEKSSDIEVAVTDERGTETELIVRYNEELIDKPVADAWIDRYRRILSAALKDDQRTLAALAAE